MTLVSLQTFSADKPPELFTISLLRAKFCELIAGELKRPGITPDTGFLLGIFSLLDVLLNQPMEDILDEVALTPDLNAALLGEDNELRRLLDLVIAYEQGDWDKVVASCTQHNLPTSYLKPCYDTVLEWYNMLQAVS